MARTLWTTEADAALCYQLSSLDSIRPRRGRKSNDEMKANDWWALVALGVVETSGLAVTGTACARRARKIAQGSDFPTLTRLRAESIEAAAKHDRDIVTGQPAGWVPPTKLDGTPSSFESTVLTEMQALRSTLHNSINDLIQVLEALVQVIR